ncbi:hypothetical protein CAEBREN_04602 [Caenorhabditis brenneri]|uniref:Uncharacterized protein n=1 Tax=Caenorhabditis brenneri TaxID=135651 RepID=G0MC93_CAEBE|nr:hypothetical protein CAEBREN_04602 [Caenorhabditis brenneri]
MHILSLYSNFPKKKQIEFYETCRLIQLFSSLSYLNEPKH